jgi:hypothetical protein
MELMYKLESLLKEQLVFCLAITTFDSLNVTMTCGIKLHCLLITMIFINLFN